MLRAGVFVIRPPRPSGGTGDLPKVTLADLTTNHLAAQNQNEAAVLTSVNPPQLIVAAGNKWYNAIDRTTVISTDPATPVPGWDGKPTSNLMAELGHSFIANGQQGATSDGYRSYGVMTGAADDSGQVVRRLGFAGAFGNGGDTSIQAGVRLMPALAACPGGVLNTYIVTNDPEAGLSNGQTMDELKRWKQAAFDAKTVIIFHTVAPRGNDTFPTARFSSALITQVKALNARILAELPGTGCYVEDHNSALLKPGTEFDLLEKYSPQDGKHPGNAWVQEVSGPRDGALLKQIYSKGRTDSRINLLNTNPSLLEGLTTTFSTTPPTGWSNTKATGTTGTIIEYRKATTPTGDWCEVRLSGTAATANAAIDILRQIGLQAGMVTGRTYEGFIEYEYDSGMSGILAVQLGTQEAGASTALNWDNNRYATQKATKNARAGAMRTPPFKAIDGLTDHRFRLSAYMATDEAPAAIMRFRTAENGEVK